MSSIGAMLRLARQRRGLHQKDAAPRLGLEQPILSRIENDLTEASDDVLYRAEKLYHVPKSFFSLTDTIYGPPVSVHPMWRKKADVPARALDAIVAELNIRAMHLRRLLNAVDLKSNAEIPRLDIEEFPNVEKIASLVRAHWQIPSGPIKNLTVYAERAGIVVVHSSLADTTVSGVTFCVPGLPPIIILNEDQPGDRMRFTLAHEIGHLVMHRYPRSTMEQEADEFASCLLMPAHDMRQTFHKRKIDLALLGALKPEWRVSMQSLLMRARSLGYLSDGQNQYLWKQISARGLRLREPPQFDIAVERPTVMACIIGAHKDNLGYSDDELAKLLSEFPDVLAVLYGAGGGAAPRPRLTLVI